MDEVAGFHLMPVERIPISSSQLAELLDVDPARIVGVERDQAKREGEAVTRGRFWIVLEPKEEPCKPAASLQP